MLVNPPIYPLSPVISVFGTRTPGSLEVGVDSAEPVFATPEQVELRDHSR